MKRLPATPYVPRALIVCMRCGARAYALSGTKICECPEDGEPFFISGVETARVDVPDDVA